jgi:hypothetical protein
MSIEGEGKDIFDIREGETPPVMMERLVRKAGPAAQTITSYLAGEGITTDSQEGVLLGLCGAFVAAAGRRSSRKFSDSETQVHISGEWDSALRAYNFMAEIIDRLGDIDGCYTRQIDTVRPSWEVRKPEVKARLTQLFWQAARRQITLVDYRYLEANMMEMVRILDFACNKYDISLQRRRELTEKILEEHYRQLPEYDESRFPPAYEVRGLEYWKKLIGLSLK